jgi:hypothetical protein
MAKRPTSNGRLLKAQISVDSLSKGGCYFFYIVITYQYRKYTCTLTRMSHHANAMSATHRNNRKKPSSPWVVVVSDISSCKRYHHIKLDNQTIVTL